MYFEKGGEKRVSKRELASQYVDNYLTKEIDRRTFFRLMAGLSLGNGDDD
jgi:hypothetical protein